MEVDNAVQRMEPKSRAMARRKKVLRVSCASTRWPAMGLAMRAEADSQMRRMEIQKPSVRGK